MLWFDSYERHARGAPGLLMLLPVAIIGTVTGLQANPAVAATIGALVAAGGPLVLAGIVRQRGLAVQVKLFSKWGGPPTTDLLLLGTSTENRELTTQRRSNVARISGVALADERAETEDRDRARQLVESAVTAIRERTRNAEAFPLVAAENRAYGFERNMLGIRDLGIICSALATVALGVDFILALTGSVAHEPIVVLIGVGLCFIMSLVWLLYPTEDRVKRAGNKYAVALLDSASTL